MSSHGVGRLHIVSKTVKAIDYIEILQNKLLPTARDLLGNQSWIFQDDNAPFHRAKANFVKFHVNGFSLALPPSAGVYVTPLEVAWVISGTVKRILHDLPLKFFKEVENFLGYMWSSVVLKKHYSIRELASALVGGGLFQPQQCVPFRLSINFSATL
ncbi:hypothetical protein TNCV_3036241 [Trichonephila clavipes]|nr:hypothetical protein TNCV_3036241 [Trichonephila clavipes]